MDTPQGAFHPNYAGDVGFDQNNQVATYKSTPNFHTSGILFSRELLQDRFDMEVYDFEDDTNLPVSLEIGVTPMSPQKYPRFWTSLRTDIPSEEKQDSFMDKFKVIASYKSLQTGTKVAVTKTSTDDGEECISVSKDGEEAGTHTFEGGEYWVKVVILNQPELMVLRTTPPPAPVVEHDAQVEDDDAHILDDDAHVGHDDALVRDDDAHILDDDAHVHDNDAHVPEN